VSAIDETRGIITSSHVVAIFTFGTLKKKTLAIKKK
jgi:hypothetical protein